MSKHIIDTRIIDISWPITSTMTTYKDKKSITLTQTKSFETDNVREHELKMSTHTGTHIDAPAHFLQDGTTMKEIPLGALIGPCSVLDLTHVEEKISDADLKPFDIQPNSRVLFKTKNSLQEPTAPFDYKFIYLDDSGAQYLANLGVTCVGIDYLGIERDQKDHQTHKTLLEEKIPIIEGLRLGHVAPGAYTLYCLPLALPQLEAAPARAVLIRNVRP